METITIFIDAEYLLQSLRELKDSEKSIPKDNFDFAKFIDFLLNGRKINSVYYYTARLDKNENPKTFDEQTEFLNNIKNSLNAYNVNIRLGQMIKTKLKIKALGINTEKRKRKRTRIRGYKKALTQELFWICANMPIPTMQKITPVPFSFRETKILKISWRS